MEYKDMLCVPEEEEPCRDCPPEQKRIPCEKGDVGGLPFPAEDGYVGGRPFHKKPEGAAQPVPSLPGRQCLKYNFFYIKEFK